MENCLFCKIIRSEVPSFKVYEDDLTLAFLDIHPVNKGHVLVIPKNHSTNILDISAADWAAVAETGRKVAIALDKALSADGVNLMMNNREHAGQVIDHPHLHFIPRFKGDGLKHWPGKDYADGEGADISEKIRSVL